MFQVLAPVVVHYTVEARQALGAELVPAGKAAWRAIAACRQGLELAHLAFQHAGVSLALCSRLRADGVLVIEIGLGEARQGAGAVPAAALRRAEARMAGRGRL